MVLAFQTVRVREAMVLALVLQWHDQLLQRPFLCTPPLTEVDRLVFVQT